MTTIRTENRYPNIPPPAGAVTVYYWEDRHLLERASRYWVGTMRRVGRAEIMLDGTQWADGTLERCLTVHGVDDDKNMPTDSARKIAAALTEAADEIDGLT